MSKKSKALYVPGRQSADAEIASLDFYDLIKRHYHDDWSLVDDALAGIRPMPLVALMHGMPVAGGDIVRDFFLWEESVRLEVENYASQPRRFLCEAAEDMSFESLDAARAAIGRHAWEADEHALRVDFFGALFGDVHAARRLTDAFGSKPGLMAAFARMLDQHAMKNAKGGFAYRPAVGMSLLMSAARQEVESIRRAVSAFNSVVVWDARRRQEDGDAAEDAIRQRRDNLALDVVDRGAAVVDAQLGKKREAEYLAEVAENPDAYAAHDAAFAGNDEAGRLFVAGAFAAWKAKRALGKEPNEAEYRAAADEIVCRWELDEDRKIPIDVDIPEVARQVLADKIAMDAKEAADLAAAVAPVPEDELNKAEAERERVEAKVRAAQKEALRQAAERAAARRVLVLEPVDTSGMSKDRSELLDQVRHLGLEPLELAEVEGLADVRREMVAAYPHAVEVIDRILADLVEGEPFKVRPTLLVGSPGAGKTSLLVDLAVLMHVPRLVYPCAGVCDSSFVGTSAQWGTKRISIPLELVRTSGIPNPLVVLDEVEKAGQYTNGGRLVDGLLPLLEGHSAAEFFEVGIERRARLQHVSYVATANSLEGIPAPLRDRFRILRMPDPGPEHVGDLVRGIVGRIRSERGLDDRWVPDLAPDEESVVRKAWAGGSLRRLRRAVEATLDARESVLRGRAM